MEITFLQPFTYLVWIALGIALNLAVLGYFLIPMYYDILYARWTSKTQHLLDMAVKKYEDTGEATVTITIMETPNEEEDEQA